VCFLQTVQGRDMRIFIFPNGTTIIRAPGGARRVFTEQEIKSESFRQNNSQLQL
jgi:hypothetical protein